METDAEQKELTDEEWAIEEGVPLLSDDVIQKYFDGRDALLAQEDKHRSDRDFRELLSPMAQEACAITSQIRFEELQTVWTPQLEEELAQKTDREIFPGMMFMLAKERMEKTKLWKIVKRMPKGALLHCHLSAMVDHDWLFRETLETPGIHITASGALNTPERRETAPFTFSFVKDPSESPAVSIWTEEYAADSCVPITSAADSFPDGGREGFITWLKLRTEITPEESVRHHCGIDAVWRKFGSGFPIVDTIVRYEPIFRKYLRRMFKQMLDDGIRWADVRSTFIYTHRRENSDAPDEDFMETFRVFGEELEKFKASDEGQRFWGARLIWTSLRFLDDRTILRDMKECIKVKLEHPDLLAGYDMVGYEDHGRSLAELTPLLLWFRKQCATQGVSIPFFFHAGETVSTGGEPDLNMFDAVLLGSRRLGHAFSLYKHPLLLGMVRDRRILVEVCPVSEEVLRLCASMASHPLPALLAQGVACALANDDPAVLGQGDSGASADFWQALQAIESLGLEGLGAMAENSVRWAAFEDLDQRAWTEDVKNGAYGGGVRARRIKEWKSEWERFCQWVVMEFGLDDADDPGE